MTKEQKQRLAELAQKRIADLSGFEVSKIYITNIDIEGATAIITFSIPDILSGSDFDGLIAISLV